MKRGGARPVRPPLDPRMIYIYTKDGLFDNSHKYVNKKPKIRTPWLSLLLLMLLLRPVLLLLLLLISV